MNTGNFPKADSLARLSLSMAQNLKYLKGQAYAFNDIGAIYDDKGEYTKAMDYYARSLDIKKQMGDKHGIAMALNNMGLVYQKQSDYGQALVDYNEALERFNEINDKNGIAISLDNIGEVYFRQGNYPQALQEHLDALKILEELGDKDAMALSLQNIGDIYFKQYDYTKALDNFHRAIKLFGETGDKDGLANTLNNIGEVYFQQGDSASARGDSAELNERYSLALKQYGDALKIRQEIGDKDGEAIPRLNMGEIYMKQKKYDEALQYFMESLKIFEGNGTKDGISICLNDIADNYTRQKKYKEALEYADKGLTVAKEIGSLEGIEHANQSLSGIYESIGNGSNALDYYKAFVTAHDSIFNQENTKKSVRAEMNFDFEKKQASEKADQDKKDALQQEQARKQRVVIYFISGILLLVMGIAVFAYRSYLQKQRTNRELDIKNQKIEAAYKIISTKNLEITDSINYAMKIQQAILPSKHEIKKALPDSFVLFKPKDIVSGDFYFYSKKNGTIYLAAADCTGHGVPGAFMSMIGWEKLNDSVEQADSPNDILKLLNTGIKTSLRQSNEEGTTRDGMDIALCGVEMMSGKAVVNYSGANRPLWMIRKGKDKIEEIKATKREIAGFTNEGDEYENHKIELFSGDSFYIFSDGYADQFGGEKEKKLTTARLRELLLSIKDKPMTEQERELDTFIEKWKAGREQVDDILVMGVRV